MFDNQQARLLSTLDDAHAAYYKNEIFDGPSFCFHVKSLEAACKQDFQRFAECSYAMLVSWGMHRMGPRGPKMREFGEYCEALKIVWPIALRLQQKAPDALTEPDWECLETIFRGLRCMQTETLLVAHSKVMAHMLPNLVAPVDREYTLKFLFGTKCIPYSVQRQWERLRDTHQGFFYPVMQDSHFRARAGEWLAQRAKYRWDTSALKIVDNLVIGISGMAVVGVSRTNARTVSL